MTGLDPQHQLLSLPLIRQAKTCRSSSWDRTGGNKDNVTIDPGARHTLAEIEGSGQISHIWMTVASPDLYWGRRMVLRAWWDGEDSPSVEAPLGDFFGQGNCRTSEWWSLAFSAGPVSGRGLNCWLPMPFYDGARIELENQGPLPALAVYYYVDYELWPAEHGDLARLGRLHAWWNREAPTHAVDHSLATPRFGFRGENLTGDENYLLVEAEGEGHYIGCNLFIYNESGGWWGEGDDMFFIDGENFPPSLHGTGTEDYFGTAWSPSRQYFSPYHGVSFAERRDWRGFSSWYRFHLTDPIRFRKSLKATIEHGHANDRSDDWSSVAYWYQREPHRRFQPLPPPSSRIPPATAAQSELLDSAEAILTSLYSDAEGAGTEDSRLVTFARMFLIGNQIDEKIRTGDWDALRSLLDSLKS